MCQDFWLLREGERAYRNYQDLLRPHNPSLCVDSYLLAYFVDSLRWIPTLNPAYDDKPGTGLNWYGPTIINSAGGAMLQGISLAWKQLFICGPAQLKLRRAFVMTWPFPGKEEQVIDPTQLDQFGQYEYLSVERDWLVETFTQLAQFGSLVATGKYFLFHMGE
jgi:hypothetical protein